MTVFIKKFSFAVNDLFNDIAIDGRDKEYYPNLISQIDDNMFMLKKALLLFKEMVIDDKIPNHIKNANKKYYTYDYKCNICGSEQIILDKFEEYFEKHVICEKYENKDFRKTSETRVSESFYGTLVGDLLDDWEKRLL